MLKRLLMLLMLALLSACAVDPPSSETEPPNDLPAYAAAMSDVLQQTVDIPPAVAATHVSGTTVIEILVKPNGEEISAKIYRSSGTPIIDQIAFSSVAQAIFPPFPAALGTEPRAFIVPVTVRPSF